MVDEPPPEKYFTCKIQICIYNFCNFSDKNSNTTELIIQDSLILGNLVCLKVKDQQLIFMTQCWLY